MSKIIGLDLSLTGTGLVILEQGAITTKKLIRSKPTEKTPLKELQRLMAIKAEIQMELERVQPDLVLMEGLAFNARNTTSAFQLAGLNYLVRECLLLRKIPFIICAPTSLKKFVIGKGNGGKDQMLLELYKKFGISFTDNNIADGFALAQCGVAIKGESKSPLTKPQMEVVKLLKEQYEEIRH